MSFWYRLVSDYDLTILTSPVANYLSIHLRLYLRLQYSQEQNKLQVNGHLRILKGCLGGGGVAEWSFFLENLNFENVIEQPILNYIH